MIWILFDHILNDLNKTIIIVKKKNSFIKLFLYFFSQIFAGILYIYQINIEKKIKENPENKNENQKVFLTNVQLEQIRNEKKKKKYRSIWCLLILLTNLDFLIQIDYQELYSYEMKKNPIKIGSLFLYIMIIIIEKDLLNFQFYRHHFISLSINILVFFIYLVISVSNKSDLKVIPFFLDLLINILKDFIKVSYYSMIKKINNDYFINMNFILFIQGIIGIVLSIIYCLIFKGFFFFDFTFPTLQFGLILLIIFFCIINCLTLIIIFKILEDTRPSYIILLFQFSFIKNYFLLFFQDINSIEIIEIIIIILSILSFSVFFEILTLNFCDLDKYTNYKTLKRVKEDNQFDINRNTRLFEISDTYSSFNASLTNN